MKQAPHPNAGRLLIAWPFRQEAKMLYEELAGQADIRANSKCQDRGRAGEGRER